jgi:hypothetical protein
VVRDRTGVQGTPSGERIEPLVRANSQGWRRRQIDDERAVVIRQHRRRRWFRGFRRRRIANLLQNGPGLSLRGSESEVAMVALVERFDQIVTCRPECCVYLSVGDSRPAGNVDRAPLQMITVGHAADGTVVSRAPQGARNDTEGSGDANHIWHVGRTCARVLPRKSRRPYAKDQYQAGQPAHRRAHTSNTGPELTEVYRPLLALWFKMARLATACACEGAGRSQLFLEAASTASFNAS